jgi:hypothetical protein
MTAIALVSAKGAPGVTTSAVLLAAVWPSPALLVEADPAGGDLRCWYTNLQGQPLRADVGVVSLLSRQALGAIDLQGHSQLLPGGLPILVGPETRAQFDVLRGHLPLLADSIALEQQDVLVDLGRLGSAGHVMPLLDACALSLVVCRATVASIRHTRTLLAELPGDRWVLLIGSSSQRADATQALDVPPERVMLLAEDPDAADALAGAWTRRLDRSALVSSGRHVAATLHGHLRALEPKAQPALHEGAPAS